ncbi:hypothetical protein [Mucilaginibacter sp. UYCu711]|uniref:hypothetical protein n=1 Tax=Mucilaginibacter sp. UYCu711 TaxID=3156339 RepID=UPI003D1A318E
MDFDTLSTNQKLNILLNALLVVDDGVIDEIKVAQTFDCRISSIRDVAERLKSDGFIKVKQLYRTRCTQQISITPKGKLFTSHGGYAGKVYKLDKLYPVNYINAFNAFSKWVNRLTIFCLVWFQV